MGRRTIAILVFLIGVLIIAVAVGFYLLRPDTQPVADAGGAAVGEQGEGVSPTIDLEPTLPPTVGVYVSLQTIPRGFRYPLTEEELEGLVVVDQRIAAEAGSNLITDVEDLLGLYARNDVFQGETLTKDAVVDDPTLIGIEDFGPSSLIPAGSIAAAIPMDRLNSVAYALDEGDHIDIMITFSFYQIDEEFQTYLQNAGVLFLQQTVAATEGGEAAESSLSQEEIAPYGRFEVLPNGDLAHIGPSEFQRPIPITMILQNAKVIQVGAWEPPALAQAPTPIPTPSEEGAAEATPTPFAQVTPIPDPPNVLVIALSPQQQLLVKYAVESNANIDFAMRGANDGQLYTVENIDLEYMLLRFGIEPPPNSRLTVDGPVPEATATPQAGETGSEAPPEGG